MDRRFLLFIWLTSLVWLFWLTFVAKPPNPPQEKPAPAERKEAPSPADTDSTWWAWIAEVGPAAQAVTEPPPDTNVELREDIVLGEAVAEPDPSAVDFLTAKLTNLGAAVSQLTLNRYYNETKSGPMELLTTPDPEQPSYLLAVSKQDEEGLQSRRWEVDPGASEREVSFRTKVRTKKNLLEIRKRFSLNEGEIAPRLAIEVTNLSGPTIPDFQYWLTGGNGLPIEGVWYTQYYRHAVFMPRGDKFREETAQQVYNNRKHQNGYGTASTPLQFLGVTDQYFASLVVQPKDVREDANNHIAEASPIFISGESSKPYEANIGVRLASRPQRIEEGQTIVHEFLLYNGPKDGKILAKVSDQDLLLDEVIHYPGLWIIPTGWVSRPIVWILNTLYSFVHDYGIAILLLTIIVRICLYPLTYHQNRMMLKMKAIQPLMQQIKTDYADDKEKLNRKMMELMQKHKVNPMGGCLPILVQLPIFVGLWQGLQNSFALRQAEFLFGWTWIKDLSAPDQLFRIPFHIPIFTDWLGPYFNLLPILAIIQIIVQMQIMSPPATTPELKMQQRIMKIMMCFMGFLFYKVPSGLCIYIITSGLWGLAERKFMPKPKEPQIDAIEAQTQSVNGASTTRRDESWKKPIVKKKAGKR